MGAPLVNDKNFYRISSALIAALDSLNQAIVLERIHFRMEGKKAKKRDYKDGHYWMYATYGDLRRDDFPFWSENTIRRTIKELEDRGLLIVGHYNKRASTTRNGTPSTMRPWTG